MTICDGSPKDSRPLRRVTARQVAICDGSPDSQTAICDVWARGSVEGMIAERHLFGPGSSNPYLEAAAMLVLAPLGDALVHVG